METPTITELLSEIAADFVDETQPKPGEFTTSDVVETLAKDGRLVDAEQVRRWLELGVREGRFTRRGRRGGTVFYSKKL